MTRALVVALVLFAVVGAAIVAGQSDGNGASGASGKQAPIFEIDPFWPKPLPNHWVMGSTIGLSVDDQDHVWVIHRPQSVEDNFKAAAMSPPTVAPPRPPTAVLGFSSMVAQLESANTASITAASPLTHGSQVPSSILRKSNV